MRIMLAIDSSRHSEAAVQSVAERPWPADSVVRVFSVLSDVPPPAAKLWSDFSGDLKRLRAHRREEARQLVADAAALLGARGIRAETLIAEGSPTRRIIEQAKEWKADLIVLASHWRTAWERWIAGSVSMAVVRHAACTVEIYRDTRPVVRTE